MTEEEPEDVWYLFFLAAFMGLSPCWIFLLVRTLQLSFL